MNMENLKDSYTESRGRVFKPLIYTDDYVFLRSEYHGHVELRMCRRDPETGEVFMRRAAKFTPGFHNPEIWLREHSESMPQNFVPSTTREIIGECDPCTEAEAAAIKEDNHRRYTESKQRVINLKHGIKTEDE